MHGRVSGLQNQIATTAGDITAVEKTTDDTSVVEDEEWFSDAAKQLFPTGKAGTALHYTTGVDERSCQRYAAGTVKPPAYFLRTLFRSEQGWTWLQVIMDGSDAAWWREVQSLVECARAFEAKRKQLEG